MGAKSSKPERNITDALHSDCSIEEITDTGVMYGKSEESIQEYLPIETDNKSTFKEAEDPPVTIPDDHDEKTKTDITGKTLDSKTSAQPPISVTDYQVSLQEDGNDHFVQNLPTETPNTSMDPDTEPDYTNVQLQKERVPPKEEEASEIVHKTESRHEKNGTKPDYTNDQLTKEREAPKERQEEASEIVHKTESKEEKNCTETIGTQTVLLPLKDAECQTEQLENITSSSSETEENDNESYNAQKLKAYSENNEEHVSNSSSSHINTNEHKEEDSCGPMEVETTIISNLKLMAYLADEALSSFVRSGSPSSEEERYTLSSKLENIRQDISTILNLVDKTSTSEIPKDNVIIEENPNEPTEKNPSPRHTSAGDVQDDPSRLSSPVPSSSLLPVEREDVITGASSGTLGTDGQRASSGVEKLFAKDNISNIDSNRPPRPIQELTYSLPQRPLQASVDVKTRKDVLPMREAATEIDPSTSDQPQDPLPKKKKKRSLWRSFKKQMKKPFKNIKK